MSLVRAVNPGLPLASSPNIPALWLASVAQHALTDILEPLIWLEL